MSGDFVGAVMGLRTLVYCVPTFSIAKIQHAPSEVRINEN